MNRITLKVTDQYGEYDTETLPVTISTTLTAKLHVAEGSTAVGIRPLTVKLIGSGYYNLSAGLDVNNIRRLTWNFGDGSPEITDTTLVKGRVRMTIHMRQQFSI